MNSHEILINVLLCSALFFPSPFPFLLPYNFAILNMSTVNIHKEGIMVEYAGIRCVLTGFASRLHSVDSYEKLDMFQNCSEPLVSSCANGDNTHRAS